MNRISLIKFGIVALALSMVALATWAYANPSSAIPPIAYASATTTRLYIGPSVPTLVQATTTPISVYNPAVNVVSGSLWDRNFLYLQRIASGTTAVLNIKFQFNPTGDTTCVQGDWYDDNSGTATSTSGINDVRLPTQYNWLSTQPTSNIVIPVPTLAPCVRAVFTTSGATSSVWYQWGPIRETK